MLFPQRCGLVQDGIYNLITFHEFNEQSANLFLLSVKPADSGSSNAMKLSQNVDNAVKPHDTVCLVME